MSVRVAQEKDLAQMLAVYGPYVKETAISFEYDVPALEEFTQRFRQITAQFPWLVWEEDGQVLGYAYASAPFERAAFGWCAEPSIYLAPQAQGRGVGRRLYEALESILQQQGYRTLYAIITSSNTGSVAFHKAMGYSHLAEFPHCGFKQGSWHGITWLQKQLNPVDMPSGFPIAFPDIGKV